jgi:hydroxymethylbilane synthase
MSANAEDRRIVLASRASQLARIQTHIVLDALKVAFPDRAFDTSFMSTQGDKDLSRALYLLGGKSLWTKELEVALLKGEVDMLVHSLKDVPTAMPEGCALGAILEREYGEDSLVVKKGYTVGGRTVHTLDDLPAGAVIGTSSVRRVAQLKRRYPDLVFKDVVCLLLRSHLTLLFLTINATLEARKSVRLISPHDILTDKLNLVYARAHKARRVSTNWTTQTDPMPP